ncbi:MAG: hypothetical protein PHG66_04445 [Candidatus Colwellbacteria bacterium]|nr:hypothetical protein [Candidatus Colwellbacteria bacterium]
MIEPELWCLKIVIAHPDYKRSFASVYVKHYTNKENAEIELRRQKEEFMDDWDDEDEESDGDEELTEEEIFDTKFEGEIFLVKSED